MTIEERGPVSVEELASKLAALPPERARAVLCEVVLPIPAFDIEVYSVAAHELAPPEATVAFAIRAATMDPEIVWVGEDALVLRVALECLLRS